MKKWFTGLLFLSLISSASAQNDAALAAPLGLVTAPVSGCSLTNAETVTVRIFNAGPGTINAPFDVSFSVTGPIVSASGTETVFVGSIAANSTMTYTFLATADMSLPGTYSVDATVTVAGDPNATNDTYVGYSVTNNAASDGGTATGGTNVCTGVNSGNITLVGNVGNVLNWEYSTDMGITWVNISNTTTSQSYNNLTAQRWYRATVQNASCASATSTTAVMTIDATSVGGTTSGGTTPTCSGANSGTITLSGKVGNVVRWERSTDGGVTWIPIANVTTTQTYLNLVTTTRYRAFVQNGACAGVYSTQRTIVINPPSVGGSVTSNATVCSGANSGTLTLAGHTGSVLRWQRSIDGGAIWTNIANTTTSQNYTNLVVTTMYRAQVQSSGCTSAFSTPATITVVSSSVGGTISSSVTECEGVNDDTLHLSGYSGSVLGWELSTDAGTTWSAIANTTDSLVYSNITQTTFYRAQVINAGCPAGYSDTAIISIDSTSVGGTVSGAATVCASGNSGSLVLSAETGSPTSWESSVDAGVTWNTIANTSNTQAYTNLTGTTLYRALVQSGVCAAIYSDTVVVTVDSITVAGSISASSTLCSGLNTGNLNVVGHRGGVLNWETSTDGGLTWVNIANVTTTQSYNNIATTTQYRAQIQNGVCASATALFAVLTVDPQAAGGSIIGGSTVCSSANSGTLTLIGYNSSIVGWESSIDGGTTFSPIANTTSNEAYSNLTQTTIYRAITASGVCPNDTSLTATITVDSATVAGTVTIDDTVCAGANSGTLQLTGENGTVTNWEMSNDGGTTWITLANDTTVQDYLNLLATTSFRAKVKNGVCPAVGSSPATITVNQNSDGGTISSSATVCENLNFGVLTLSGHVGTILDWESSVDNGATWVSLTNTGTTQSYTNLPDTTWYHAIVMNGICANDTSTIAYIYMYPAPLADFNPDTVCLGTPLTFVNTTTNISGFVTLYNWDLGDGNNTTSTNPTHTYSAAGTYPVILFAQNNFGCSDTAMHSILVNALPVATIFPLGPTSFCEGDSVVLAAPFNVTYDYSWNTGDTTFQIVADTTFDYTVTVTDLLSGCVNSDTESVIAYPLPIADAGLDTSISLGTSVILTGSGGVGYLWSPPLGLDNPFNSNPVASPTTTTVYTLTVTSADGCTAMDSMTVTVDADFLVTVRNIITPNGDGFNDTWVIENILSYPANTVNVFNRYGQKVYDAESYNNLWDGTYNGNPLPDGTYYYVLEFTDSDTVVKGAVNIIRSENK